MSKKKSPVRRDEDFEELDLQLEEAMRTLESINERTATVLQRVEQGVDVLAEGTVEDSASTPEPAAVEPAADAEAPAEG